MLACGVEAWDIATYLVNRFSSGRVFPVSPHRGPGSFVFVAGIPAMFRRHFFGSVVVDFVLERFWKVTDIEGKVVVITGGSSGLGEATAKLLAERGAKVMLGARREDNLERIVSEIDDDGGTAAYRVTDVTNRDQSRTWSPARSRSLAGLTCWSTTPV